MVISPGLHRTPAMQTTGRNTVKLSEMQFHQLPKTLRNEFIRKANAAGEDVHAYFEAHKNILIGGLRTARPQRQPLH